MTQFQQHPSVIESYVRHGWRLVPIPPGTKKPINDNWNDLNNTITSIEELPEKYGIGIAHAYSGTMALDIDDWDRATEELSKHGIDLQSLYDAPDAVTIDSGKPGHGKLLYAMPNGPLRSKKLLHKVDGKNYNYLDFRCATSTGRTTQDILPPSIHPETHRPYRWGGKGNWQQLPTIPNVLLTYWQSLLEQDNKKTIPSDTGTPASWAEIHHLLECVSPDLNREEWITVGMALHWTGCQTNQLEQALYLWDDWSAKSIKYPGERQLLTQWNSFSNDKPNSVTLGSLFHIAREYGWEPPVPDISSLFGNTIENKHQYELIHAGIRPPAPDINLNLFPELLASRAMEISESVGCDPLVPLWAGLAAICAVADARTRLQLMEGYQVPPILWLMTIGDPADKKSPGSRPMLSALKQIELNDKARFSRDLLDWEAQEAMYAAAKKAFLDRAASGEHLLDATTPNIPDLPKQPTPLKITVNDITSQKLVRHAADRPRGLLCYLDEMNSWVRKLTDKTSGEDRSTWVVSYEGEPYEMDRVGAGSIHCDNLAVSIYGNIQPKVFKEALPALSMDGLLQRFLPAVLRPNKTRLGEPIPECLSTKSKWDELLESVFSVPEMTYLMSPDAYQAYRSFQMWYEEEKRTERLLQSSEIYMTAFGKLEGTAGRLILIFHLIENPYTPYVHVDVVNRVVELIKSYIIPVFRYSLGEVAGVSTFDTWLADNIIFNSDKSYISLSEIKRSARRQIEGMNQWAADQMIINAMYLLESANWVARTDDGTKENQHIAHWAINPQLIKIFAEQRKIIIKAKQQRLDAIYKLSTTDRKLVKGYEVEQG